MLKKTFDSGRKRSICLFHLLRDVPAMCQEYLRDVSTETIANMLRETSYIVITTPHINIMLTPHQPVPALTLCHH